VAGLPLDRELQRDLQYFMGPELFRQILTHARAYREAEVRRTRPLTEPGCKAAS
jgi:hypothetical protein